MAGVLHFDNRLKVKIRNRNEEISYQMHVFANQISTSPEEYIWTTVRRNVFIYLKIQVGSLRAHILTDLNNENRNVNMKKFLT